MVTQVISAVDNIRRRAEAIAQSHYMRPGEELDLQKLTEIKFNEANEQLFQDFRAASQELQGRSSDLHAFQTRGKLWRILHAFQLKSLNEKMNEANAEYRRIRSAIEESRAAFYSDAESQHDVLQEFEALRKNKVVRNDALALCRAADTLIAQLNHNAKLYPALSKTLTSGLTMPDGATLSLAEASAFLNKVTAQMLSAIQHLSPQGY